MQTAKVLGTTRATIKHASFVGQKLLIVQPLMADGSADGPPLLTLDGWGASRGDTVLLTSDSSCMEDLIGKDKNTPARWTTMGIIDQR
ncbi:Ethanolamine utilization protein EutN [Rosistilla oblonga]|uniref:Ethanolamine utilization protein EutN n=3 Tax=Rosistilla TaxID=2795779 RepID=A0A518IYD8_9BACT|nr:MULTISPECIES: EutN/CcmL family microcompartment protein [Rosistilla]QDS89474.1 Ethanolamine utilization protein EutN [Rosistilla ulvae]QDV13710.1 Ethanolamine utilization protein EutN [Rosistilla oblonga]QDV58105.1 Ethanolamine utilization protein EutN [Rosistilla oblonga]QDV70037.1 Ethanolamine utilization protein EutN [Rosistilla carotiformis]